MKPWLQGAALLIGAYVFFVYLLAPSRLFSDQLQAQTPLELSHISGNLWSGHAANAHYGEIDLGELHWRLSPWSLMFGEANTALQIKGPRISATGRVRARENSPIRLEQAKITLPASLVHHLQNIPVDLQGNIEADITLLEADQGGLLALDAQIHWRGAAVEAPIKMTLGDYQLSFETQDKLIKGKLKNRGGPLRTSGDINISNKRRYSLVLNLAPNAGADEGLRNLLPLLGKADSRGAVTIREQGDLMRLLDG